MSVYVNFSKGASKSESLINYTVARIKNSIRLTSVDAFIEFSKDQNGSHQIYCKLEIDKQTIYEVINYSIDFYSALDLMIEHLHQFFYENGDLYRNFQQSASAVVEPVTYLFDEYDNLPIDADDLIKYESARQKVS